MVLDALYKDILKARSYQKSALIDNIDFVRWALNHERNSGSSSESTYYDSPEFLISPNEAVAEKFESASGAQPITNIQQLEEALNEVYYQRADFNLEHPAIQDLPYFEPLDTCSFHTAETAYQIQGVIFELIGWSIQRVNME